MIVLGNPQPEGHPPGSLAEGPGFQQPLLALRHRGVRMCTRSPAAVVGRDQQEGMCCPSQRTGWAAGEGTQQGGLRDGSREGKQRCAAAAGQRRPGHCSQPPGSGALGRSPVRLGAAPDSPDCVSPVPDPNPKARPGLRAPSHHDGPPSAPSGHISSPPTPRSRSFPDPHPVQTPLDSTP